MADNHYSDNAEKRLRTVLGRPPYPPDIEKLAQLYKLADAAMADVMNFIREITSRG